MIDCSKCIHDEVFANKVANDGLGGECGFFKAERPQGDLISREALKKEVEGLVVGGAEGLKDYYENGSKADENSWIGGVYDTYELINNAPPVPDRQQGEWIEFGVNNQGTYYKCSKCGFVVRDFPETINTTYPFCTCGADMRGGEDHEASI